jgi:hypothetical protein
MDKFLPFFGDFALKIPPESSGIALSKQISLLMLIKTLQ